MVDLELRKVVGLMEQEEIEVFEQTCADFLNDGFSRSNSPVEGVRCRLMTQDLTGRRRRRLSSTRHLQDDDTLELYMRVTGLFVPTDAYPDADSVEFGDSVIRLFTRNGDEFVENLARDAEARTDYYEDAVEVKIIGPAVPVPVPFPTPSPVAPTKEPTQKPTRIPVSWPTTESPSRTPTEREWVGWSISPCHFSFRSCHFICFHLMFRYLYNFIFFGRAYERSYRVANEEADKGALTE